MYLKLMFVWLSIGLHRHVPESNCRRRSHGHCAPTVCAPLEMQATGATSSRARQSIVTNATRRVPPTDRTSNNELGASKLIEECFATDAQNAAEDAAEDAEGAEHGTAQA